MTGHELSGFYLPWAGALIASSAAEPVPTGHLVLALGGFDLPIVQLVLAIAGVLMARPLAPRRAAERGWWRQLLVTLIMLIIAAAWVIESIPGVLFAFVVALGLGFSGYALIELAGTEIENVIRRIFATAADALRPAGRSHSAPAEDTPAEDIGETNP